MPQVILLCASPRKGGNTDLMADAFARGAQAAGATVEKVYLDDLYLRPAAEMADDPKMRVDLRQDDDARKLLDRVLAADVVLFASPVYWHGVTAQLKCFVDRWSCYWGQEWFKQAMQKKVFAVVTAHGAPAPETAQQVIGPIEGWAAFLGARFAGAVSFAGRDRAAVAGHPDVLAQCAELGRRAVELAAQGD
jgi:multimeric flavodoxin WrbA